MTQGVRVRLGETYFVLEAGAVERVLPMLAWTEVAQNEGQVVGVCEVRGKPLAVVDPRPRLGLAPVSVRLEQHLVLLSMPAAYALWVDRVEAVLELAGARTHALALAPGSPAWQLVQLQGETLPLLDPAAFYPHGFLTEVRT